MKEYLTAVRTAAETSDKKQRRWIQALVFPGEGTHRLGTAPRSRTIGGLYIFIISASKSQQII